MKNVMKNVTKTIIGAVCLMGIIVSFIILNTILILVDRIDDLEHKLILIGQTNTINIDVISERFENQSTKIDDVVKFVNSNTYEISQFETNCLRIIPELIGNSDGDWRRNFNVGDMSYDEQQYLIQNKPNSNGYVEIIEKEKYERKNREAESMRNRINTFKDQWGLNWD